MSDQNVLVIEDDAPIRALLEAVLHRSGNRCEMAASGKSGLEMLRSRPYDVVLLDLLLPDVSGFDILVEMKRAMPPLLPRTIVMTAAAESAILRREELDGTWRIFRKPLDINDLIAEIDACGAQRPRDRKAPMAAEPLLRLSKTRGA